MTNDTNIERKGLFRTESHLSNENIKKLKHIKRKKKFAIFLTSYRPVLKLTIVDLNVVIASLTAKLYDKKTTKKKE